jgi:starch synthase
MRIVFASSEAAPFSKTGGLADVSAALPKALSALGHDVTLITPFYPQQQSHWPAQQLPLQRLDFELEIPVADRQVPAAAYRTGYPQSNVRVLLVDQPSYFDRSGLYQERERDYRDNSERFIFFSRAVLQLAERLQLQPDIVHSNDWQTGLIPALLKAEYADRPGFPHTGAVFTIHNLAFQGQFWHWDMLLTGLDWKYFNWRQMEFFGQLNLLKTGIVFADMVTTVSPTYAREIQTPDYGCGLNGVLSSRQADLVGILNGIDLDVWHPAHDPHLPFTYNADTVTEGKRVCKALLQQQMGLPQREDVPLFGMISRMTSQKGFDLLADCLPRILQLPLQMVFLGSGDSTYEQLIQRTAQQHPDQVACKIGYHEPLSHLIEAGSDVFLMPSQYEPCGLNQMYSLQYGTVPIVRAVGGLADSVVDASPDRLADGTATGFCFGPYRSDLLFGQVQRAVEMFPDRVMWRKLQQAGMSRDWSWTRSAGEYLEVYARAQRHRQS